MIDYGLKGRVVPVSGAASGIGLALCHLLHAAGATPIILDKDFDRAKEKTKEIYGVSDKEVGQYCLRMDVTDAAQVTACFDEIIKRHGRIDDAVSNAAIRNFGGLIDQTDEQWHATVNCVLNGTFYFCRNAARDMIKRKTGAIVTLSAIGGLLGTTERISYAAAKGAVVNLTRSMAVELAQYGIRVNSIAPGPIKTPLRDEDDSSDRFHNIMGRIPLHRQGEPEELANAIMFMLSNKASFITGQILAVDGGLTSTYQ